MKKSTKKNLEKKKLEVIDLFNQPVVDTSTKVEVNTNIKITKQYNLLDEKIVDIFIDGNEVVKSKPINIKKEDIIKEINKVEKLPNNGRRYIIYNDLKLNCPEKMYFNKKVWLITTTYEEILTNNNKDLIHSLEQKFKLNKKNKYTVEILSNKNLGLENPKCLNE